MRSIIVAVLCCVLLLPLADAYVYRPIGQSPVPVSSRNIFSGMSFVDAAVSASPGFGPVQLDFHPLVKGTPAVASVQSGTELIGKLVLKKKGSNAGPISPEDDPLIYIVEVGQSRPRVSQATERVPQTVYANLFGNRYFGELADGVNPSNEIKFDVSDGAWYFRTRAGDVDSVQHYHLFVVWDGLTKHHGTAVYAT